MNVGSDVDRSRRTGSHGPNLKKIGLRLVRQNPYLSFVNHTDAGPDKAREVFQTALEFFGDEEEQVEKAQVRNESAADIRSEADKEQAVFSAFARMETRLKEFERARVIYKVRFRGPCCL